ncbi:MAG: hypothetical protein GX387_13035 [Clostridium sp.]|nr:hypothetical protein [Clostridium sp.]
MEAIKGFKVFKPDWTYRGFQYEVGKTYEENVTPSACDRGFFFYKQPKDCFNYYRFNPNNKVAEVVALGEVAEKGDKCCTNKIKIVREIPWEEVLKLVNTGKACTGFCNTGDYNTGDWNLSSFNVGCFNTNQHKLKFFDKETDMTMEEWWNSDARYLLNQIDFRPTEWVRSEDMTDAEKEQHPEHETTGGYLKIRDNTNACIKWWNELSESKRNVIKSIPNFDAEKFFKITGIRV